MIIASLMEAGYYYDVFHAFQAFQLKMRHRGVNHYRGIVFTTLILRADQDSPQNGLGLTCETAARHSTAGH